MTPKPIPAHCRGCVHLHTGGLKDGKHNRWCCQYSRPAADAVGHCKNVGGSYSLYSQGKVTT